MKSFLMLAFVGTLAPVLAFGKTVQNFIIDPSPPGRPVLEKTVDYFTSRTMPSVVLGSSGIYLYQSGGNLSGPWTMSVIDPEGDFYERARAFTYPGDPYPGVVASRSGQLVWYANPLNSGGDPAQPWPRILINPNAGCHDLHVADLDGNGKPDIACSATFFAGTQSFIAFQNNWNDWQIVNNPFRDTSGAGIGDSIGFVSINGSPRTHVVGATPSGIYWFENPGNRTGAWVPHLVGNGGSNNDASQTAVAPVAYGWTAKSLDSTYRANHEINSGNLAGSPLFIVAEQESVSSQCNSAGYDEHPSIAACRVVLFEYQGRG